MAKTNGPETVDDWCARNGATMKKMAVAARKVVGYGEGARHYKVALDRDGADAVFPCDWIERATDPEADVDGVVEDLRDVAILVERIKDDAESVKAQFAMENPATDWKKLFNEMVDLRVRFMSWCGPVEFAKLVKTQGGPA